MDDLDDELIVVDDTPTTEDVARLLDTTQPPGSSCRGPRPGSGSSVERRPGRGCGRRHRLVRRRLPSAPRHTRRGTAACSSTTATPTSQRWVARSGRRGPEGCRRAGLDPLAGYYSAIDAVNGSATYPFGTNMAIQRSWLEAVGGFDERLGRRGRSLASGEETQLFERIERLVAVSRGADRRRRHPRRRALLARRAGRGQSSRPGPFRCPPRPHRWAWRVGAHGLSSAAAILTRGRAISGEPARTTYWPRRSVATWCG